ncbi:MAG TPA: lysophospholipid acyltransferase family protein [Gemmatimonadales bacterium]|nr:lysophospholipid acyltransferase family protein [Gemmatimonadales bacterium]
MSLLRTLLYIASIFIATIWWGLACIVAALAGVEHVRGGVYDRAARNWGRWLCAMNGLDVRSEGLERLPSDRPYVYIANHFSVCDIWALLVVLPDPVRFIAKKELFAVPILGPALRAARHIPIDRQNLQAAFSAYEEAAKAIRSGFSAVVYAEGTRSRDGKLQPFKKGPFVLAIASQVPAVPVWVDGAFEALPKGQWWVRPGVVTIRVGTPVPTAALRYDDRERLMEEVRGAMVALSHAPAGVRVDPIGARG